MMNGKTMRYAGTAVLMIFIAVGAYLIGYKTAYDRMERAAVSYETETSTRPLPTFSTVP